MFRVSVELLLISKETCKLFCVYSALNVMSEFITIEVVEELYEPQLNKAIFACLVGGITGYVVINSAHVNSVPFLTVTLLIPSLSVPANNGAPPLQSNVIVQYSVASLSFKNSLNTPSSKIVNPSASLYLDSSAT